MNNNKFFKHLYLVFLMLIITGCGGSGGGESETSTPEVVPQNAIQYRYDGAGRLISETHGNGAIIKYQYDNNGNVLARTVQ